MRMLVLLILIFLVGCTSLPELRQMKPVSTKEVTGQRKPLANCLVDELRQEASSEGYAYDITKSEHSGTTYIEGRLGSHYEWEASLTQILSKVRVVVRSNRNVWGTVMYPDRNAKLLHGCVVAST